MNFIGHMSFLICLTNNVKAFKELATDWMAELQNLYALHCHYVYERQMTLLTTQ